MKKKNLLLSLAVGFSTVGMSYATEEKPNFIFYILDDVSQKDIGCYGNKFVDTPNFDRIAREGVRFTNAYVA
ncbi:sulfatase-like hydrolase/transferase [Lentisphaerota bacterium WC36G]